MRHTWIIIAFFICCSWMTACQTETDSILTEEYNAATKDSLFINNTDSEMGSQRGIRPLIPSNSQNTVNDENRGEKGRDRRDGNIYFADKFDQDAPPARLNVLSVNASGDYVIKLVFGPNYRQEEIEYAFEGRTLKICFIDEADQIVETFIIDNYHIGDEFILPAESFNNCIKVELYVGYFIGEAFWYVGDQSFDSIFD